MPEAKPGTCKMPPLEGFFCSREEGHAGPCACHPIPMYGSFHQPERRTPKVEHSGGPTSYYLVHVDKPNQGSVAYTAECGDIIEALQMTFAEGCEFKAIWRTAAARFGKLKHGGDPIYDADKRIFYAQRSRASYAETGEYMEAKKADTSQLVKYLGAPLFGVVQEAMPGPPKYYLGGIETSGFVFKRFMELLPADHPQQYFRHGPPPENWEGLPV